MAVLYLNSGRFSNPQLATTHDIFIGENTKWRTSQKTVRTGMKISFLILCLHGYSKFHRHKMLRVRGLNSGVTEKDLRQDFSRFGELCMVHLALDKVTRKSRG